MSVSAKRTVRRLGGTLAAEVDVDLTQIDDAAFELVHEAFLEHCVLVFRDQDLDPESHIAFTRRFGEVHLYPRRDDLGGPVEHPEIVEIANLRRVAMDDGTHRKITEVWHPDSTFFERPPAHVVLAAKVLPEAGGDTLFANQYAAYEALSDGMKTLLGSLRAVHRAPGYQGDGIPERSWPAIVTHPETGRKLLYVNVNAVHQFEGMTEQESDGLLRYLFTHQTSPEFCYRHRWQHGDVVIWDNRCTQHYAVDDYGTQPRVLARTSVVGHSPS